MVGTKLSRFAPWLLILPFLQRDMKMILKYISWLNISMATSMHCGANNLRHVEVLSTSETYARPRSFFIRATFEGLVMEVVGSR